MSGSATDVVVLAAGRGSRLGAAGAERPKWLLDVAGRTIAERQLAAVERARDGAGARLGEVTVVTGHAAGAIGSFLDSRSANGVATLHNPHYAEINNWYSVLLALRELPAGGDRRVVILNGDLCAGPEWIAAFLAASAATPHESLIGIDLERELTDESMKVAVEGEPKRVTAIGKAGVPEPAGEYVGLLMARGEALRELRGALERFVGQAAHRDEWYERAVGLTAAGGVPWVVWATPDSSWVEIDDDEDLARAAAIAGGGDG